MMWKISTGFSADPQGSSSWMMRSMSTLAWMKSPSVLRRTVPLMPMRQCSWNRERTVVRGRQYEEGGAEGGAWRRGARDGVGWNTVPLMPMRPCSCTGERTVVSRSARWGWLSGAEQLWGTGQAGITRAGRVGRSELGHGEGSMSGRRGARQIQPHKDTAPLTHCPQHFCPHLLLSACVATNPTVPQPTPTTDNPPHLVLSQCKTNHTCPNHLVLFDWRPGLVLLRVVRVRPAPPPPVPTDPPPAPSPWSSGRWSAVPRPSSSAGCRCWSWSSRCPHSAGTPTSSDTATTRWGVQKTRDTHTHEHTYISRQTRTYTQIYTRTGWMVGRGCEEATFQQFCYPEWWCLRHGHFCIFFSHSFWSLVLTAYTQTLQANTHVHV